MATQGLGEADQLFRHPRDFDRKAENSQPFLDDSDSDDAESESSDDDESDSESGDEPDDEPASSAVRRLSRRRATDKPSPDSYQDAQVVKFVEKSLRDISESSDDQQLVALIDDQTDTVGGQSCRGGLTRRDMEEVFKNPRFTEPHVATGHSEKQPADINRRIIGIPGLDAPEMEVLAANATATQKDALLKCFRHHINPSPLIECDMPSTGFKTLSLQFHVPYMVMRQHREPCQDPRRRPNGDPLRGSWPVEFIPATTRGRWYLHQAQRSLSVVVIDERVWTAIGTYDIFFDGPNCKASVGRRHRRWANKELQDRATMDPMRPWRVYMPGNKGACAEADPGLYFLAIYGEAMEEAQRELAPIVAETEKAVNHGYPTDAAGQAQDSQVKWNATALDHIRRVMTRLSDLLDERKTFESEDSGFFNLSINASHLRGIKQSFNTLEKYHKQLALLKKKLKRNEAEINQQLQVQVRDGQAKVVDGQAKVVDGQAQVVDSQSYNQTLAKLIIYLSPLSQVMSLFNIQGLPFALSPASFTVSLVAICCLWAVVYLLMERTTVTTWGVYVRRYLGHTAAGVWERVWRGKEVFELDGSRPGDGPTPPAAPPPAADPTPALAPTPAAAQDPSDPGPGPGPRPARSVTWPFSMRTRQERQDAGYPV